MVELCSSTYAIRAGSTAANSLCHVLPTTRNSESASMTKISQLSRSVIAAPSSAIS